jgi:hypothetical protein
MLYKRVNHADGFAPYARLLTAWEAGADNVFQTHFNMYATLLDAA